MKHFNATTIAMALALAFGPAHAAPTDAPPGAVAKAASEATAMRNAAVLGQLPFEDRADFEAAGRGLVAPFEGQIRNDAGEVVWDSHAYDFLQPDQAPAAVNPSLWRQAQRKLRAGLFQGTDRVYQLRGMDLANITVLEGDRGLIIIDPLM
ncbi:MAG: hypothetical protein ABWZ88_04060, partial [Variovorax sp.]